VARDTTIPIGVWLPATAVAVVWFVLLARGDGPGEATRDASHDATSAAKSEAPAALPPKVAEQPPAVAVDDPKKEVETPPAAKDEPAPKSEPPPKPEPPPSEPPPAEPPSEPVKEPVKELAKEPAKEPVKEPQPEPVKEPVKEPEPAPAPPPAPELPPPPAGWQLLSAPTDPATALELRGATAAALLADWSAALGAARDQFVTSGDRLAPWLIVAARESPPSFETLLDARARVERELLVPLARRVDELPWIVVARQDEARRAAWRRRDESTVLLGGDASAAQLVAALTRATLAAPGRRVPEWWLAGAAAMEAAGDGHVALAAPPPDARLAPLFEPPPAQAVRERAAWETLAGSFTAWCLLPDGGGAHAAASWFETEKLGELRESAEELAARFGCAQFAELEARWQAARR